MLEMGEYEDDEVVEESDDIEDNGETEEEDEEEDDDVDREESDSESKSQDFDNIWKVFFVVSVFELVLDVFVAFGLKFAEFSEFCC